MVSEETIEGESFLPEHGGRTFQKEGVPGPRDWKNHCFTWITEHSNDRSNYKGRGGGKDGS